MTVSQNFVLSLTNSSPFIDSKFQTALATIRFIFYRLGLGVNVGYHGEREAIFAVSS